ncbi:hypothetical protein RHMOL_Rhmol02G0186000 [Rhododendron molle]|uniref:Uncharacterized protein n=1 Tax=Rhododendron molle TaxID=49168 RepID=A0ACC0PRB9_RHOML|nr:hypothetical protein RHMOL_Rhmol02G0186000 [Rhododendron molle]
MASQIPVVEGSGQPSYALRHLIADKLFNIQDPLSNLSNAFFIPDPPLPGIPILGPAFNELPLAFTINYPVFEECRIFHDHDDLDCVRWIKRNFICWPVFDPIGASGRRVCSP